MESYDTKKIFSENLRRILSKYGMTQSELAEEMGVAYSSVSSWCTGEKMPRMDKIEWIARRFNVLKSDLIEDKGKAEPPVGDI